MVHKSKWHQHSLTKSKLWFRAAVFLRGHTSDSPDFVLCTRNLFQWHAHSLARKPRSRWYSLRSQKTLTSVSNHANIKRPGFQYQRSLRTILASVLVRLDTESASASFETEVSVHLNWENMSPSKQQDMQNWGYISNTKQLLKFTVAARVSGHEVPILDSGNEVIYLTRAPAISAIWTRQAKTLRHCHHVTILGQSTQGPQQPRTTHLELTVQ